MFVREIGDEFEYRKGKKVYTLKVVKNNGGYSRCDDCVLRTEKNCHTIAGNCGGYKSEYSIIVNRVKDLDEEINKTDIESLTKAIKSIGESLKIVEMFKQLANQNKEAKSDD